MDTSASQSIPDAPGLRAFTSLRVQVGEIQTIACAGRPERRLVPIHGGVALGPGLRGHILQGGHDTQLVYADGTIELTARYTIASQEGCVFVTNSGLRHVGTDGSQYFRSRFQFETEVTDLSWLHRTVFVASSRRVASEVLIDVFEVT